MLALLILSLPDLKYNDKKMTMDLLVNISTNEYVNIEVNTSLSKGIRLTDLKDAEESGITKGIEKGIKKGIETEKKKQQ